MPGRQWEPATREWTFPLSSLPLLLQRLSTITEQGVYVQAIAPLTLPPRLPPNAAPIPPPPSPVVQRLFQDTPPEVLVIPQISSQGGGTTSSVSTPEGPLPSPPKRKAEVSLGIFGRDRVSVQFGYDQSVQAAVKAVKGAEWSQGKRKDDVSDKSQSDLGSRITTFWLSYGRSVRSGEGS
jgi:hypothetical protein